MVRVNTHKLEEKELRRLYKQLGKSLGRLNAAGVETFLEDLLGPEEYIAIAKRLAIIVMLSEGYSFYRIADTLKISVATASRVNRSLDKGAYDQLLKLFHKNKNEYLALLNTIENILTVGGIMPSRAGLDRYRGLPR